MSVPMLLASASPIRAELLRRAGFAPEIANARIDEGAIRESLLADGAPPRDIADALAEAKARKIGAKHPDKLVIGCDQVLDLDGTLLSKPESPEAAKDQLSRMQGKRHTLYSAAVVAEEGAPVWRHIGQVRLRMRELDAAAIEAYVERNWDSIRHTVGCYKIEEEGVRLFSAIDGDYFSVLGMPLIELVNYLVLKGADRP